ncbi:dipeptide ABC transporter ATP-binding protein [Reinekea thalattae]|uniref:ABC transporter ATP-binding protein n=1 Tax=Reinekea thalattae TaxID=2593301 RepID=A0A5C8Z8I4_9GAMM|nr:ABC transporter ATP-binding protein [Reinekea thalattae]TXR54435.1 ABC transporter ATP-binding protein [Reinekea thalattae]
MSLLDIENLTVAFPHREQEFIAVNNASLKVEAGQIHGLVGESGAGKSTVGAAIMGLLDKPGYIKSGTISLNGETISGLNSDAMRELRGQKISMIFQDPLTSLNPLLTVGDQLVETIRCHLHLSEREAHLRALDLLKQVRIPDPETRLTQYPHQFSGGMRQRIVIALALCSEPDVIIADEPTTALDVSVQAQILQLIKELVKEKQVGVILVTHDMGVIAETTDVVSVMYQGQVIESGATQQLLRQPSHAYTQSLISAVPRPDKKLHRFPLVNYQKQVADFNVEQLAKHWQKSQLNIEQPLLEVSGVSKEFLTHASLLPSKRRYLKAVDNVSFSIEQGQVFGIVGESGSGKSTIARVIAGLYKANAGSIRFAGQSAFDSSEQVAQYRRQIQMIFQDPYSSLNPRMRIDAIIAEPAKHHKLLTGKALQHRVDELLDQVGLGHDAGKKYPHEFSGGQRQRISIARALATQPRLLICDEPTSALDVSIQAQILNILKDLQQHLNLTMLFISHDLPVIRQMCDQVGVMQNGIMVEQQATEELFNHPQHRYTEELLSYMPKFDAVVAG